MVKFNAASVSDLYLLDISLGINYWDKVTLKLKNFLFDTGSVLQTLDHTYKLLFSVKSLFHSHSIAWFGRIHLRSRHTSSAQHYAWIYQAYFFTFMTKKNITDSVTCMIYINLDIIFYSASVCHENNIISMLFYLWWLIKSPKRKYSD